MSSIRVQLSETQRPCTVDNVELQNWGRALLDKILFSAAKTVSESGHGAPVEAQVTFKVTVDPDSGDVVIDRGD